LNVSDAAATAKHTDLTAAKILFAQIAKGQDDMTDVMLDRLTWNALVCSPAQNNCRNRLVMEDAAFLIKNQAAEIERLREALKDAHWYYLGDDCSSDQCRFGIDECISEDFEWDNPPQGDHVLQISGARPVPDMWVALHYFSEEEKDERDDDEPYSYTVHATEDEALAALAGKAEQ